MWICWNVALNFPDAKSMRSKHNSSNPWKEFEWRWICSANKNSLEKLKLTKWIAKNAIQNYFRSLNESGQLQTMLNDTIQHSTKSIGCMKITINWIPLRQNSLIYNFAWITFPENESAPFNPTHVIWIQWISISISFLLIWTFHIDSA